MAEFGQVGVVSQTVGVKPPAAQHWCNEGSQKCAHINKYVEDLETRVALSLCPLQTVGALLGSIGLEVVVHLSDNGLQVALEQSVATGNECKRKNGEGQQPRHVAGRSQHRNGKQHVARSHDDKAPGDGAFVVLSAVGNDAAHEAQHVDGGEKHGGDESALPVGESEL